MPAVVDLKALIKAVQPPKMKRMPRGAKGSAPNTTTLNGKHEGYLLIEAPSHSTRLDCQGSMGGIATVEAGRFHEFLKRLNKLGGTATLSLQENKMAIHFDTTAYTIPLVDEP